MALVVALPGIAVAQRVELEGRAWFPDVTAEAKIEGGSLSGTRLDFAKDLGIDDHPLGDLRLSVFTGPNSRLRLAYTLARYEGDAVIGRAIEFNGTLYPAATRVVSELEVHYVRFGWSWLPSIIPGKLRLGPVLEAKAFVTEARLEAPATTPKLRETERLAIVVPTIGLALDVSPHPVLDVFAEASGLAVGHPGHVVDVEAGVRIKLHTLLTVTGGYRFFEVRGEEDKSFARLRLSGPFVGASLRF